MLNNQTLEYQDQDILLEAYCCLPETLSHKTPIILVVHDWSGRNHFADQKADELAKLGYIGLAIDMYGKGKIGQTTEEKKALMNPLIMDRKRLLQRIQAALTLINQIPQADPNRVGAIGFCFGGLCVLDLARSGAKLTAGVSFHGLLDAPATTLQAIHTQLLVLHGHDDPMVPPEQVLAFEKEMSQARADWQLHIFSDTQHAFMNPEAHDPAMGTVYRQKTAERAWQLMKVFFAEAFT